MPYKNSFGLIDIFKMCIALASMACLIATISNGNFRLGHRSCQGMARVPHGWLARTPLAWDSVSADNAAT